MPSLGTIARKIAGLPEPAKEEAAPPQTGAAEWEAAGAQLAARQRNSGPPAGGRAAPWTPETEPPGTVAARRVGRGLVWTVLGLAVVTGVRSWVVPPQAKAPPQAPAATAPAYPDAAAQAVAARAARAYLTWDEDAPEERAALLAAVLPASTDTAMGWDGHGHQDVTAVEPGAVTPGPDRRARVRVDVLVTATGPGAAARWVGLDVPVAETGGRVVVTGPPGLVGIPAAGPKIPAPPVPETDHDLSRRTEGAVRRFLAAYAHGDVDAVTAPGAKVPPLPAGIALAALDSWAVDAGNGDDRTGTALVTWTVGGASLQQTYRVVLARVSSGNAARWQVADLKGGQM
ncbi:conjugal transfer protein [Streptomyces sp. NBC_01237]|uniref:conjugal transfer protein n=1 Tax=Streptomyces sp. NBC_01237 TaxID=2903790 RepID=UPI002DDB33F2|nr:conjugal transfer protein [Streptomyces sp. NBC_01237]WRZ78745.1 conjugal transfer protein [Streptomyces sp. NBC_01237]